MAKSRMKNDPLEIKKPRMGSDPLEWIKDSRSEKGNDPVTAIESQTGSNSEAPHKTDRSQLKQAVVLSGGGATGAFEVGVLKALIAGESPVTEGRPLPIDIITGTSVGAFNAACMALHSNPETAIDHLENIWLNRIAEHPGGRGNGVFRFRPPASDLLHPGFLARHPVEALTRFGEDGIFLAREWIQRSIGFLQSSEPLDNRALEALNFSSFVSTEPFQKLIQETIRFEDVRRAETILKIVATNWETGEARVFGKDQLTDETGHLAIMASAALPGFFPPVTIDEHLYCDGGVVMNTPTLPAIQAGAEVLHVIYMDPDIKDIPPARLRNTLDTFDRMLTIQFAANINKDIEEAERINNGLAAIEHAETTGSVLEAGTEIAGKIRERLKLSKPYRKLHIHRYHPREDLSGVLGLLNFDRQRIQEFIKKGFQEAVRHDCDVCGCINPDD